MVVLVGGRIVSRQTSTDLDGGSGEPVEECVTGFFAKEVEGLEIIYFTAVHTSLTYFRWEKVQSCLQRPSSHVGVMVP